MEKRNTRKRVQKKLVKKAGMWALKTVLTSLPVVGLVFKVLFAVADVAKEVRATIKEEVAKSKTRRATSTRTRRPRLALAVA